MSKVVTFNDSVIRNMSIEVNDTGASIIIVGEVLGDGDPVTRNLELNFADMPSQVKNAANNFMKHLSREYSNYWVEEDKDTWVDI